VNFDAKAVDDGMMLAMDDRFFRTNLGTDHFKSGLPLLSLLLRVPSKH